MDTTSLATLLLVIYIQYTSLYYIYTNIDSQIYFVGGKSFIILKYDFLLLFGWYYSIVQACRDLECSPGNFARSILVIGILIDGSQSLVTFSNPQPTPLTGLALLVLVSK